MKNSLSIACFFLILISCSNTNSTNYQNDLNFIKSKTKVIELVSNNNNARILITPDYQGRVITSTNKGLQGSSNGWINYNAFTQDSLNTGQNIGGEDRLWIGPLGGQYSFYYQQIKPISDDNWKVPDSFNAEAYSVTKESALSVEMNKQMELTNFIGTHFKIEVHKKITLLSDKDIKQNIGISLNDDIKMVAFSSEHALINRDSIQWTKDTGLPCIWSLAMLPGTNDARVMIPLKKGTHIDDVNVYLSKLNEDKMYIDQDVLNYKVDGKFRNKLGLNPEVLRGNIFVSLVPETQTLTIIEYKRTNDSLYFNSEVSIQENPYVGEPIQIYNNGPMDFSSPEEHSFYELESTSAMKELMPDDSITHFQRVYHLSGKIDALQEIIKELL